MKISKQFQGKIFGDFIDDLYKNHYGFKIPEFRWEDRTEVIIRKYEDYNSSDKLRWYFKIFDYDYPKEEDGHPLSYSKTDEKTLINHLEYMRYVLSFNGASFKADIEEWDRIIQMYNR